MQSAPVIYGYARVWTNVQSVAAQAAAPRKHRAGKVFREGASGAKTDRAQLRRLPDQLDAGGRRGATLAELARSYHVGKSTYPSLVCRF